MMLTNDFESVRYIYIYIYIVSRCSFVACVSQEAQKTREQKQPLLASA